MKVLGIDPGIARLGWGVIEEKAGVQKAIVYGCITTKKTAPEPERLSQIFVQLKEIIEQHKPQTMAIEDLFFATNAKTAFQVGQARGVVLLAAAQAKLPVASYSPLKIKMAMVGYGQAQKHQVQQMVTSMLGLRQAPKLDDTADALAVALTHLTLSKFEKAVKTAQS